MANHKKRRAPKQRGHCHMCKYYKDDGNKFSSKTRQDKVNIEKTKQEISQINL